MLIQNCVIIIIKYKHLKKNYIVLIFFANQMAYNIKKIVKYMILQFNMDKYIDLLGDKKLYLCRRTNI